LNSPAIFPICEPVEWAERRDGLGLGAAGPERRYDMSQPLGMEGLGRMSRMTLLEGEIWLGGAGPESGLPRFVRSPEAGYPPYNIELLAEGEDARSALRITLAVAGFSVDELAVSIEDGQLIVRGKQVDEHARDYLYRGIAARRFKRSFGLAVGVEVRKAELQDGLLAIELERPVKDATVKTVRIVNGETAAKTYEALKAERATVSDAE
jgi:HSP20 family molecular chaperone IbpA